MALLGRRSSRSVASSRGRVRARVRRRVLPALAFAGAAGLALACLLLPVDQGIPGGPAATVAAIQGDVPHARDLPDLWRATGSRSITPRPRRNWPPRSGQGPGRCLMW